ncbi:family 43 glycosylhydrolase [Cohnella pontilimi]|uniref:family 43 glycosylhydrolase n=1 Tax=Cohnella pontilimi TaxID=2564100 RepID=UPI00145CE7AC|nr:family 43 glycosylhydrolase [Cohnella pontilimi]
MNNRAVKNLLIGIMVLLMALPVLLPQGVARAQATTTNNFFNVIMQDGADPWMMKHPDGWYYFTKTTGGNVTLWRSKSITGVDAGDSKVVWTPPANTSYSQNIWAPELHYLDYKWYIYFAADDGRNESHRMYVLENESADPFTGTWTFKGKISDSTDRWAIDGTVLEAGGIKYFIWSGWEGTTNVKQNLYIAQMTNPWTIGSERVLISSPTYPWETNTDPKVNEGPEVIVKGNTINLVYSASGSWTDTYSLGLITASISSNLLDPTSWTKKNTPIFQSGNGIYAPGHASFVKSPDGSEDWIIYHTARHRGAGWDRNIRTQKFIWNSDNTPNFGTPANPNIPIQLPSGEQSRSRYEAEDALLANGPRVVDEASASGGKKVGFKDNLDSYIEFTVTVENAGYYVLAARTGTGIGGWALDSLQINGGGATNFYVINSGWNNWGMATANVYLEAGVNKVRFTKKVGYAEYDCLEVFPGTKPTLFPTDSGLLGTGKVGPMTDNFNDPILGNHWIVGPGEGQANPDFWSLNANKGFLTITTQDSDVYQGRNQPLNYFLRQAPQGDYEFTTKLDFSPERGFEQAGLTIWNGPDNFIKLAFVYTDRKVFETAMESEGRYFGTTSPNDIGDDVYLKIKKEGNTYTFFASGNGDQWSSVGIPFQASYGNEQIGLFAISPVSGRNIPAKFDFFKIHKASN